MHPTRRIFMLQATTACLACPTLVQATPVDESSETAVALGYKHDTTKVDAAKFPRHQADQHCANCQFWQAKPTDPWSGCAMFGRKAQVAKNGWCVAWAKIPG
ncbi:high-potential iron-sulfur protein [Roseateles sp.]|uniref:high-potential iron-sulfur protein n=1 Tax=Roseateles sp. TaxID=1971397 RepID=UPI0025E4124A|nr:high-potential iron-sulfur protein [Roseateles sp.]MBV8037478.1 high-potential iron-sulfur protein [Roseateles sp.]